MALVYHFNHHILPHSQIPQLFSNCASWSGHFPQTAAGQASFATTSDAGFPCAIPCDRILAGTARSSHAYAASKQLANDKFRQLEPAWQLEGVTAVALQPGGGAMGAVAMVWPRKR